MAKIKKVPVSETQWQYHYHCLGCGYDHAFSEKLHKFNGDVNNPTVSPSLLEKRVPGKRCHSFIKNGMIQYLNDCWHHLRGKTIQLPDYGTKDFR